MDGKFWTVLTLLISPVVIGAWKSSQEERRQAQELRRGIHYHSKRHMLPSESEVKRRVTTTKTREVRKKPSGHLTPLEEDDIDNDEVVSVAIGPPPVRPKYEKMSWKHQTKSLANNNTNYTQGATNLVKDVLTELGREFLTHQVNEDFVFGQYVGNTMRNLTSELRLRMQHEILEVVIKYQRLNRGDIQRPGPDERNLSFKESKIEKKYALGNDTDEGWPDFTNLAKIVG